MKDIMKEMQISGFPLGFFLAGQMSGNNLFYRTNLKLTGHVSIIIIRIV